MELIQILCTIVGVCCILFGVTIVAGRMLTTYTSGNSFRQAFVLLILGGFLLVFPSVSFVSLQDDVESNSEEKVQISDEITYLGMRNESEMGIKSASGIGFSNGHMIPVAGAVPVSEQQLYLYFDYHGKEVKVDDTPKLYFKCENLEYGDILDCEVSVVETNGTPDMDTATVVSIDGIAID